MRIYLYCTYEHSMKGFFMTRLDGQNLIPAREEGDLPEMVDAFFFYDWYQVLWCDLPNGDSFFGVRGLTGHMATGRGASANLVFLADPDEMTALRRIALTMLGDYPAFCSRFFLWMSVGGACSYQLDADAFYKWMEFCTACEKFRVLVPAGDRVRTLLPIMRRQKEPETEQDRMRIAVLSSPWEEARELLGDEEVWRDQPVSAITKAEFAELFVERAPVLEPFMVED